MPFHHLQGHDGLANAIQQFLVDPKNTSDPNHIFVFDFDRTLTNGFADPTETGVERRVRGGWSTVESLRALKNTGFHMFIVTARNPSIMTIKQLEASLQQNQKELAEIFLNDTKESSANYHVENFSVSSSDTFKLAWRGPIYASDYSKHAAIRHIIKNYPETDKLLTIHFFDDFVGNAFDVGTQDLGPRVQTIHSYWWDSFQEETTKMMGIVPSFSSDFPYQEGTTHARIAFGMTEEVGHQRKTWYIEYETQYNIKPPQPEVKPEPKPLAISNFQSILQIKPRIPPSE